MRITVIVPARDAEGSIGECVDALLAARERALGWASASEGAGCDGGAIGDAGIGDVGIGGAAIGDAGIEDVEIIVVDDGSRDATGSAASRRGVRVLSRGGAGPAAARNLGAAAAAGDILLFTDADCVPDPGWIAAMAAPFADPEVTAVKGVYRTEQRSVTARFVQHEYESRYERMRGRDSIDFIDTYAAGFRAGDFRAAGGFDESFPGASVEDQEFSFRYSRRPGRMVFVPGAVVRHRHADTPWRYARKKLRIGYWKVRVMLRHPDKIVADSHTPQRVKLEMLCALAAAGALPAVAWTPAAWIAACALGIFLVSSAPLSLRILARDPVAGCAAPGLQLVRALALGAGSVAGLAAALVRGAPGGRRAAAAGPVSRDSAVTEPIAREHVDDLV